MKLLNLGCGASRPKDDKWINIDDLHSVFPDPECKERVHMDGELNYLNHNILEPFPFENDSIDGIMASHVLEHFVLVETMRLVNECYRILKPRGVLRISVPCPKRFYEGTLAGKTNWGEPCYENTTMMNYALFFAGHKMILGKYSVLCILLNAGFKEQEEKAFTHSWIPDLAELDNRPEFSLFVEGRK